MSLVATHRDLDLDALERLSVDARSVAEQCRSACPVIDGIVVLATCNRLELYVSVAGADLALAQSAPGTARRVNEHARDEVARALAARTGADPAEVAGHLRILTGPQVAEHLFAVAAGLESMVVGEREIAGQVRRALAAARRAGTTDGELEALFQAASRTSRAVERRTGLGGAGRSVVAVALDLAAAAQVASPGPPAAPGSPLPAGAAGLPPWSQARCLLVGTGSYAGAALAALAARGVRDVQVWSASGRAATFAAARGARPVPGTLDEALAEVDVVVACSGAGGTLIHRDQLARARGGRPLVVVDLALRHDVDRSVGTLPGVHLVNLATVSENVPVGHTGALAAARRIVEEAAAEHVAGRRVRAWEPAIVAERQRVLGPLDDARGVGASDAERAARRALRERLHRPTVRARQAARDGDAAAYADALAELAAIPAPGPDPALPAPGPDPALPAPGPDPAL